MNYNKAVSDYIVGASDEHIVILETLRKLIHESVVDVSEAIKWNMPVFATTKNFAYVRYAKKHVTLGFYNYEKIQDPDNLLEGEGNTLRHIKFVRKEDIQPDMISEWLKQITG